MEKDSNKFDLEERTAVFGEKVIDFTKKMQINPINKPVITQLIRSATSIGANYLEADCAESKKDFIHKLSICKKESKETKHWLRMIARISPEFKEEIKILWKETTELNLIFSAIINKMKKNK